MEKFETLLSLLFVLLFFPQSIDTHARVDYLLPKNSIKDHHARAMNVSLPPTNFDYFQYFDLLNQGDLII